MASSLFFYLRVLCAGTWFFTATLISICLIPFRWKDPSLGAVFGRLLHWGGCKAFGFNVRIENESKLYTSQPCVYVGNHQSNMDIITMGFVYPYRTVVIGKKELKWVPLFGLFFAGSGMIMIDRKNRTHSVAGLEAAKEAMTKEGKSIWLFPEGTRNRGRVPLLPFKKGAFHIAINAQVPIVPLVHQHLYSYFDVEGRRVLNKNEVLIRVLDPIPTTGMTAADLPRLVAETRHRMLEALITPEMKLPADLKTQAETELKAAMATKALGS